MFEIKIDHFYHLHFNPEMEDDEYGRSEREDLVIAVRKREKTWNRTIIGGRNKLRMLVADYEVCPIASTLEWPITPRTKYRMGADCLEWNRENTIREIFLKDFPLFVNWHVTKWFNDLLNGETNAENVRKQIV